MTQIVLLSSPASYSSFGSIVLYCIISELGRKLSFPSTVVLVSSASEFLTGKISLRLWTSSVGLSDDIRPRLVAIYFGFFSSGEICMS